MNKRVVITGLGTLSPLGTNWDEAGPKLREGISGVSINEDWKSVEGLDSHLSGTVDITDDNLETGIEPGQLRSMGRVSLLSVQAVRRALTDADLLDHPAVSSDKTGVSFGSTEGNQEASFKFAEHVDRNNTIEGLKLADYLKSMTHTCPASISRYVGADGRMISTSTACTSGSQGIGYGYEAIKHGMQDVMITGGAEELVTSAAAVFNIMFEASTRHEEPFSSPRPFDADRDGLVVAEGAGAMILESLEFARQRGANIYGEIIGFSSTCMSGHPTIPNAEGIEPVLRKSLEDASCSPSDIDYVNAHATATTQGDRAESHATHEVMGTDVPVSSLKGHMGHTLGACGAIESIYSVRMAREGWLAPNLHLEQVEDECAKLNYIKTEPLETDVKTIMSNNFGFGGVNTSLIIRMTS